MCYSATGRFKWESEEEDGGEERRGEEGGLATILWISSRRVWCALTKQDPGTWNCQYITSHTLIHTNTHTHTSPSWIFVTNLTFSLNWVHHKSGLGWGASCIVAQKRVSTSSKGFEASHEYNYPAIFSQFLPSRMSDWYLGSVMIRYFKCKTACPVKHPRITEFRRFSLTWKEKCVAQAQPCYMCEMTEI